MMCPKTRPYITAVNNILFDNAAFVYPARLGQKQTAS